MYLTTKRGQSPLMNKNYENKNYLRINIKERAKTRNFRTKCSLYSTDKENKNYLAFLDFIKFQI